MKDNAIQPKSSLKESKKRSSLKNNSNILDPHKIINYKRNSVSFNLESVKKFKKLKFDIGELKPAEKKILVEKKKKFEEVRRQSVKNEFNLVRDFLKNKMNNLDDLEDEDVKENTIKNITMGKEGLKSIESDSDDRNEVDTRSIADNNSYAFFYRKIYGTDRLSNHSSGYAIDINPIENPYLPFRNGEYDYSNLSEEEKKYLEHRDDGRRHVIVHSDLAYQLFDESGFEWGGDWEKTKDYQHFEVDHERFKHTL